MNINLQSINLKSIGDVLRPLHIDEWLFYAKLSGDRHTSAFVLRRIIIWSSTPTAQSRNGWFWKTHQEMGKETGLSEYQIRQAQKHLSKLVQVKIRQRNGKSITYYKLNVKELTRAIKKTISRITGKVFQSSPEETRPTLHERFKAHRAKNLSRQSNTIILNHSDSNNQTQTSSQPATNTDEQTNQTVSRIDDDLMQSLPAWLKNYSFTGQCDVAAFIREIERLGDKTAKAKFTETSQIGKSWQYHLNSLINEPTPAPPATNDDYSDVINKPVISSPVLQQQPQLTDHDHKWIGIREQFEMQFNRQELSGSMINVEGDHITITVQQHHLGNIKRADQHPRGITYWITREIKSVFGIDQPIVSYSTG